ncbi:MSCRAMM family protein, partial [Dysosmobacter sp.]|uniref:MSCRAMM family protein n=1 Tax=Dysosmobacter sp. TaxID=2591382 RepID=UPI002A933EC9
IDVELPDTGLKITKLEAGTDAPLGGAIFEVVGPDGATVGTFSTRSDGTVTIPLSLAGNYTVYERVAPLDHLLSDMHCATTFKSQGITKIVVIPGI